MDLSTNLIQLNEMILSNWTLTSKYITKHSRRLDGEAPPKKLNVTDQVLAISTVSNLLSAPQKTTTSAYLKFTNSCAALAKNNTTKTLLIFTKIELEIR